MATRVRTARRAQPAKLANLIEEMMSHIHRRSADDTLAVMNEAGLTMAQMVALHLLTHLGPVSVSSIAACLKLSPPATSHLVDRMVVAGLVGRTEDPIDRRHKRIEITSTGRELKGLPDRDEVREIVGKELQKREAQAAQVEQIRSNRRTRA